MNVDSEDGDKSDAGETRGLPVAPDRGRIIIVNFEMGGGGVGQEMRKPSRPCLVIQNNKMRRGRLVTVVPISGQEPEELQPYHHRMDHRSFVNMPLTYGGQGKPRWAKCDYMTTVSLDRCLDPHHRPNNGPRKYVKVRAIRADVEAIEKCVLWALGIKAGQGP